MKCVNFMRVARLLLASSVISGAFHVAQAATIPVGSVPAYTMDAVSQNVDFGTHYSIGYTFTTTQSFQVIGLGALDFGGSTIGSAVTDVNGNPTTANFPVNLYYTGPTPGAGASVDGGNTAGDLVAGFAVTVTAADPILALSGGTYSGGDGFRYHLFSSPLTLPAGTYQLVESQFATSFGQFPTNLASATGVSTIQNVDYEPGTDSAIYATRVSSLTSVFGPNILFAPVPEPGSLMLGGLGLLALLFIRRKQR